MIMRKLLVTFIALKKEADDAVNGSKVYMRHSQDHEV